MNDLKKKLVTHDGSFHTDDVFAAAALTLYFEKKGLQYDIIRSRDEELIKKADCVFDVGGVYNSEKNRFDHHQPGGAGKREGSPGIEYASFGLVWKKFGAELCGDPSDKKTADLIDRRLAAPIDAFDNGMDLSENKYDVSPYLVQHIIGAMHPTWREEDISEDEMFLKSLLIAKETLSREIIQMQDALRAEKEVTKIYENSQDKKIIILDKNYPTEHILNNFPEPLFVVYPRKLNNWWSAKTVRTDPKVFRNRKDFPALWGGIRDEELQKLTGVADAVICHRALYMCIAKTKEGAIKLAQIAVKS